jgi:hypothetical protein
MKKLKFKTIRFESKEVLTKQQRKNVLGGFMPVTTIPVTIVTP